MESMKSEGSQGAAEGGDFPLAGQADDGLAGEVSMGLRRPPSWTASRPPLRKSRAPGVGGVP